MNGNYELLQELGFSNFPEKVIWAHNCGASNITIYLVAIVMLNVLKLNVEDVKEKKKKTNLLKTEIVFHWCLSDVETLSYFYSFPKTEKGMNEH